MKSLEVSRLELERDELLYALEDLTLALEKTNWSSWQTTANFSEQTERARDIVNKYRIES